MKTKSFIEKKGYYCTKKKPRKPESFARTDRKFFCPAKKNLGNPRALLELTEGFFALQKKTSVISRGFNHQSKNEQLIRLLFTFKSFRFQV